MYARWAAAARPRHTRFASGSSRIETGGRSGGAGQGIDDAVLHLLDEYLIVTLAHDADHWLGARRAHDQPAMTVETGLRIPDGVAQLGALERLAALVTHVLEYLRQRIEPVADARHRLLLLLDHRQNLQRGEQPVAGRGVIGQNDVARRLAPDVEAVRTHVFEHVAVADRRARERHLQLPEITLEPEIGHDGRDDARLGQAAVRLPALRDHRQQLVAIDDVPALVDDEHAVAITVERDADIRAHFLHLAAKRGGLGRAAFAIDVEAVGVDPERDHLGPQFPQCLRCNLVGRTIGAIHHHA